MRFLLSLALVCLALPLAAKDADLKRLDTGDDSKGWEAVGRLDLGQKGFCTGALIAPDLVLTAAHCLFDPKTGERLDPGKMEFQAGFRNGRALAYRAVRRAAVHPDYSYGGGVSAERVRNDIALLELHLPVKNPQIRPFEIADMPEAGARVGVVSYAEGREEAPSLQDVCRVQERREGVLVMSCKINFGASGAPVFGFDGGKARIVSVVSAKAMSNQRNVSLGTQLKAPLEVVRAELARGEAGFSSAAPGQAQRIAGGARRDTGAKFVTP
ncbi:trypsin-like serine peptidase [Rhodalgimonas zhirmunskyi]|uniref:Trypsin-like serine protease n=1 Tax=Rhodalgimonas zhirmunskyi TaxID=2964767 RepID=A0AAJ1X5X4_9RHOB|nr:trypsin-like peptidase domain-containing protein [Rhodoalgimonas zhirmunskyi]MDQ2094089.1 trypsin-like serine protease [Rhodoalgimonas zhirmunskyi]